MSGSPHIVLHITSAQLHPYHLTTCRASHNIYIQNGSPHGVAPLAEGSTAARLTRERFTVYSSCAVRAAALGCLQSLTISVQSLQNVAAPLLERERAYARPKFARHFIVCIALRVLCYSLADVRRQVTKSYWQVVTSWSSLKRVSALNHIGIIMGKARQPT